MNKESKVKVWTDEAEEIIKKFEEKKRKARKKR